MRSRRAHHGSAVTQNAVHSSLQFFSAPILSNHVTSLAAWPDWRSVKHMLPALRALVAKILLGRYGLGRALAVAGSMCVEVSEGADLCRVMSDLVERPGNEESRWTLEAWGPSTHSPPLMGSCAYV